MIWKGGRFSGFGGQMMVIRLSYNRQTIAIQWFEMFEMSEMFKELLCLGVSQSPFLLVSRSLNCSFAS